MKEMTYAIKFEDDKGTGDIKFALRDIKSPIRLEVGDKIAISGESFDETNLDYINEMMEVLLKKAIKASKFHAYFEISDIIYHHEYYDELGSSFSGLIVLKGK